MTSRELTGLLSLPDVDGGDAKSLFSDSAWRIAFGAIGWPWLLYSLWGGTKASKARLLARLDMAPDSLPHLGSWKADTGFLHRIVDAVEELRPACVVELGAGASTLVCARALARNGGGRLVSYDQHAGFVAATAEWVAEHGLAADLRHAPLSRAVSDWPGNWYALSDLPESIDLLIIDGPPWAVHPLVRGAAESLFDRLSPGGVVLLDDAARPGERIVARRWRKRWPDIRFARLGGSTKGTLMGRRQAGVHRLPQRPANDTAAPGRWRRAAAMAMLFAGGWLAHDVTGGLTAPAEASTFVDQAALSWSNDRLGDASLRSADGHFDESVIRGSTGIDLPDLPANWRVTEVRLHRRTDGAAVELSILTDRGEAFGLYAARAETAAGGTPVLARRAGHAVAYWERGMLAYAVTAELSSARVMSIASTLSASDG